MLFRYNHIILIVISFFFLSACKENLLQSEVSDENIEVKGLPKTLEATKKMCLVPSGTFVMGSLREESQDNEPLHSVMLMPFYMDETPITYEDFKKYLFYGGTPSVYWELKIFNQDNFPITGISWYHAINYCNWRSKIEGLEQAYTRAITKDRWGYKVWKLDTTKNGYRLPTEAQFEYAARGGLSQKDYPWGNHFKDKFANFDSEKGKNKGNSAYLVAVKDQKKNKYGLYNMSGNIWHWCNDWYDNSFYKKQTRTTYEPLGPDKGNVKVVRGGSWGSIDKKFLNVAKRSFSAPSNFNFDIGFRCVLPLKGLKALDAIKKKNNGKMPKAPKKENFLFPFFNYSFLKREKAKIDIELYSEHFINRLSQYIADYYPNSLYFLREVDKQPKITARELAEMIVEVSEEHKIHPLFLTGVMAAESGFGSCSFPRWFNNPVAFRWKNEALSYSKPVYQDFSGQKNLRFKTLREAFHAFCKGIRNPHYLVAAKQNFVIFHTLYVGGAKVSWMTSVSQVYHDVLGLRLTADMPESNIGRMIYMDWENPSTNQQKTQVEVNFNGSIPIITFPQRRYYIFFGSYQTESKARFEAQKIQSKFRNIKIVLFDGNYRISLNDFGTLNQAVKAKLALEEKFRDAWVLEF